MTLRRGLQQGLQESEVVSRVIRQNRKRWTTTQEVANADRHHSHYVMSYIPKKRNKEKDVSQCSRTVRSFEVYVNLLMVFE